MDELVARIIDLALDTGDAWPAIASEARIAALSLGRFLIGAARSHRQDHARS